MKTKHFLIVLMASLTASVCAQANIAGKDFSFFSNHFMTKSVKQIDNKIELLFVENVANAKFTKDAHKPGCLHLTLWPVVGGIHYFTNEPVRLSGNITPDHFVSFWHKQNTASQPFIPNVDIEGVLPNHHSLDQSAALSSAVYNAKKETMAYTACPLAGQTLHSSFHIVDISIFFDGFHGWPPI
jgi:hypothetical protein